VSWQFEAAQALHAAREAEMKGQNEQLENEVAIQAARAERLEVECEKLKEEREELMEKLAAVDKFDDAALESAEAPPALRKFVIKLEVGGMSKGFVVSKPLGEVSIGPCASAAVLGAAYCTSPRSLPAALCALAPCSR
jgi:FtsZ-binding cell division protein ZapB